MRKVYKKKKGKTGSIFGFHFTQINESNYVQTCKNFEIKAGVLNTEATWNFPVVQIR